MSWKGQLKRAHKRKRKQKKLLVKLQKVVQGRGNSLGDPAFINPTKAEILAGDHPDLVSRHSRHL